MSDALYPGIEARLGTAFGADVKIGAASILLQADAYPGALFPEEEQLVAKAVAKRRNELASGRLLARRLLLELGFAAAPLLPRPDRMPRWPDGVVGSISHTSGLCVCAIARADDALALGVDVEEDVPLAEDLWKMILRPPERAQIEAAVAEPEARCRLAKLVFSAKECTYKCQFPISETVFDFLDVELDFGPGLEAIDDTPAGTFRARIHHAARDRSPHLRAPLVGFYVKIDRWLITGMRLR